MGFDLDHIASLALFARVVQLRSFTAAARQSGIAKSAVSRRIRLLEQRIGVQLLRRTTRKLAVTDEGLRFYEHCARILAAASAAEREVAAASTALRGSIRISAPVTFSQMHLASAIGDFLRAHPEVEVSLATDNRVVDVVEGGFDVVVRIGRLRDASYVARRLAADRLVVCGAPAYLARVGRPTHPDELIAHNCLHYDLVPLTAEWRFRASRGNGAVSIRGNLSTNDGTALREATLRGLGLAVLPYFMVAPHVRGGELELVLEGRRKAEVGIFAVTAQSRQLPRRTRALLDFLVRRFAGARWD